MEHTIADLQDCHSGSSDLFESPHSVALSDDDDNDGGENHGPVNSNTNPGSNTNAHANASLSSVASTLPPASPPRTPPRPSSTTTTTTTGGRKTAPADKKNQSSAAAPGSTSSAKRPPPTSTPQMMVLGKDGSDYRDLLRSTTASGSTSPRSNSSAAAAAAAVANKKEAQRQHPRKNNTPDERQQALLDEEEKREIFRDETNDNINNNDAAAASNNENTPKSSKKWWSRLWYGTAYSAGATSYNSDDYACMASTHGPGANNNNNNNNNKSSNGKQPADVEASVYYQEMNTTDTPTTVRGGGRLGEDGFQSPPRHNNTTGTTTAANTATGTTKQKSIGGKMHDSILRNLPLPSSREDQIQQDCSFLYRPVEEQNPQRSNPLTSPSQQQHRPTGGLRAVFDHPPAGMSTLYRDAQDVVAPPAIMARYHARYHQLNQEYEPRDDHDRFADYNDYAVTPVHELTLEEQTQPQRHGGRGHGRQSSFVTDTATQSSLFYEQANGRVVMQLPRDHVRLLVADSSFGNMEPGILSVIQCRGPDDPPTERLEYCLTVPTNLYQQVVSEMTHYSHHIFGSGGHGGGGLDSSFYASDHADIRVAMAIMAVILTTLGIITLVFDLN